MRCAPACGHPAQRRELRPGSVCCQNVTHKTELQGMKASVGRNLFPQLQSLTLSSCLFWKPVTFSSTEHHPPLTES